MNRLQNKVAVITGGNSGIGFATAQLFIAEGAQVIITGRNKESVDKAVAELGQSAKGIVSDTGSMKDIKQLQAQVAAIHPVIDIIFLNAGVAKFSPIENADEAFFDEQFNINVKGSYFTVQQLLPLLKEGASIVLNTSINAHIGMANAAVYAASKAAQLTLIRNLSAEFLSKKIRVNAVSPGPVSTPLYGKLGLSEEQLSATASGILSSIPMGRFGTPEEIAKTVLFLASDDSTFLLGAELIADGGMSTL
ncbi:NAD(P)-dependent dehydrogenase, short-chain alcohol dehydrogenase family [Chitinophaga sp. YR627]|uniref:SDR family oxidoreductase n=1 Tax=Chitinophaga sp. YR627 TaxID=1881041 RepID=UPI0008F0B5FB|nr:SDR family oxidoreductase [Chitinophaga sp. YR627]SFM70397.1 NAD(P)-dependent dehydrogenase, short-chain alcohol dehydrogenase family [Chitinophaga sp. YR627]